MTYRCHHETISECFDHDPLERRTLQIRPHSSSPMPRGEHESIEHLTALRTPY